jgi:hypothetical protein
MKYAPFLAILILLKPTGTSAQVERSEVSQAEKVQIEQERKPNLDRLFELIRSADRIVVTNGSEGEKKILYESRNRRDIDALSAALKLEIPEDWRMAVCADPTITLFKNGKEIVYIGDVSGREVKTSVWSGNAVIGDQEIWLRWFDDRGMPMVRKERDHALAAEKKDAENEARWYAAMPRGAKEPFESQLRMFGLPSAKNMSLMKAALEREYPNMNERIRAVLFWYGSGEGSWSGYPAYEEIAGSVLFEFSTKEILDALNSKDLSAEHIEGAARHFAGWDHSQKRPDDLKKIPASMKQRFLDQAMKNADDDKRGRAQIAFAPVR